MTILETMLDIGSLLLESGIKMPRGTKAIKITTHKDMDGVFSALLTYHQLQKQGINAKNIKITFGQYGDEEQELIQKVETHNKQFAVVLDFAALPTANLFDIMNKMASYKLGENQFIKYLNIVSKGNLKNKDGFKSYTKKYLGKEDLDDTELERLNRGLGNFDFSKAKEPFSKEDYDVPLTKPDFVSDHHQNEKGALTKGKSGTIAATNEKGERYDSDTEHVSVAYAPNLADYSTIKAISNIDSAKYTRLEDTLELPKDFRNKGRMERLAIITNSLLSDILKINTTLAIEIIKASSPSLESVYNNIVKMGKYNDKQVEIFEEMTKESPDWNKIVSLRNELPKSMAKETSKEDLKGIKKLSTVEELRAKGEEDIKKARSDNWSKEDEEKLEKVKTSGEALEPDEEKIASGLKDRMKMYKERITEKENLIKTGKEGSYKYAGGEHSYKKLEPMTKEQLLKSIEGDKEHLKDLEDRYNKFYPSGKEKVEKLKEKKESSKSQFTTVGNVMRQDATSTRDYPGRFVSSLLNKNGVRYPFTLKRWSTKIQVAMNPDAPESLKKNVDLGKMSDEILQNIKKKFGTMYNDWAFNIVKKSSGGHSGITTVSGLGTLGLMPKKDRERYNEIDALNKRALAVGTSLSKLEEKRKRLGKTTPQEHSLWQEFKVLKEKKEFYAKIRTEIMDEIEQEFYKELAKHTGAITKKLDNPDKYDLNKPYKEEEKPEPKEEKSEEKKELPKKNLSSQEPISVGKGKTIIGKKFEESLLDIAGELLI